MAPLRSFHGAVPDGDPGKDGPKQPAASCPGSGLLYSGLVQKILLNEKRPALRGPMFLSMHTIRNAAQPSDPPWTPDMRVYSTPAGKPKKQSRSLRQTSQRQSASLQT